MKKLATVAIVTLMAILSLGTPAQALFVPVGDILVGGSFGQRFVGTLEPGYSISRIEVEHLSGVTLEAPSVLQRFNSDGYKEIQATSEQAIAVGRGQGFDLEEVSFEIWFGPWGDEPAPVSFRCTLYGNEEAKCPPMVSEYDFKEETGWVMKDATVPEPGTTLLLGLVLTGGGLVAFRRRTRK